MSIGENQDTEVGVTISIGVANYLCNGTGTGALLRAAGAALYRAKYVTHHHVRG